METLSGYYDRKAIEGAVSRGLHRELVGGLWDELGDLQLEFLKGHGLRADHVLLDVGCGSLRLGVRAAAFLRPGNYWGTDLNPELLDAGFEREIVPAGLAARLSRSNLVADGEFRFPGIPSGINFAMATSVFTHLPLNHMRLCLLNLASLMTADGIFAFTIFVPSGSWSDISEQLAGVVTHPHRDPYHYLPQDVEFAAAGTPWSIEFIGNWDHPRNQKMVLARRR